MRTIILLIVANLFMTYAWYGHLKSSPPNNVKGLIYIWLTSWLVAGVEYIFMVPANNYYARLEGFSAFQLKMIQEVITLIVFSLFALLYLKVEWRWNYAVSFVLIMAATYFMFLPAKTA